MSVNFNNVLRYPYYYYLNEESGMEKNTLNADRERIKNYMYSGENNEKFLNKTINQELHKAIKDIKDGDNKKDPNILVRVLKKLRSYYSKFFNKYNSMYEEYKNGSTNSRPDSQYLKLPVLKRFLFRLSRMIDKVLYKLQSLVDRRTYDQLSRDEKIDKANDYLTHNSKLNKIRKYGLEDEQDEEIQKKFRKKPGDTEEFDNVRRLNKYKNKVNNYNYFSIPNKQASYTNYLRRKQEHNEEIARRRDEENRKREIQTADGSYIQTSYRRTPMKTVN